MRQCPDAFEAQVAQIAGSIAEFGFVDPVLVGGRNLDRLHKDHSQFVEEPRNRSILSEARAGGACEAQGQAS
jgi:hypothetical protein